MKHANPIRLAGWLLTATLLMAGLAGCVTSDRSDKSDQSDRSDVSGKLRILVDKVMEPAIEPELAVRAAAEAGFNVFAPRRAGENEATLRRVAEAAERYGIQTVGWMMATARATGGQNLVVASGQEAWVYSPNADALWDYLSRVILMHARVSRDCPALIGSFLDMELYGQLQLGWAYPISFDNTILAAFAADQGFEMPQLENKDRKPWLDANNRYAAFTNFQVAAWRQRCRALREQVDAINPAFQIWIYPGPSSRFIREAAGPEWARPGAPMVFADVDTYGRPNWYAKQGRPLPHAEALAANTRLLERDLAILTNVSFPWRYVGGIDPAIRGADPEFCFANAVMQAEHTDGYWVFYEGPAYKRPDHDAYWAAFTEANAAIRRGDWAAWKRPRQTQDLYAGHTITAATARIQVGVYGLDDRTEARLRADNRFEVHRLRDTATNYLQPLAVVVVQDYSYNMWDFRFFSAGLADFARQGGGLLALHDTLVQCDKLLPDLAAAARVESGADRHGRLTDARITVQDGPHKGSSFRAAGPTTWTFRPGVAGHVLATDAAGRPVCVTAPLDKGRTACYGGRLTADASDREWRFVTDLMADLATADAP